MPPLGAVILYAGLVALATGALSLLLPRRRLPTRTRRPSLFVIVAGGLLVAIALLLPPPPARRSLRTPTTTDEFLPEYQFWERHERQVRAAPDRIFEAIWSVPTEEIRFFRFLTGIRNPRRRAPGSLIAPPAARPILQVALSSGFVLLAEKKDRELVVGAFVARPSGGLRPTALGFAGLSAPGYAKAVMDFRIEPREGGSSLLATETRVFATDQRTARSFAIYWRVIYPGSALIRRMWLNAIAARAERSPMPRTVSSTDPDVPSVDGEFSAHSLSPRLTAVWVETAPRKGHDIRPPAVGVLEPCRATEPAAPGPIIAVTARFRGGRPCVGTAPLSRSL